MTRVGRSERHTKESDVTVELDLDGTGAAEIHTGIGFFDHLLESFAKHGGFDLRITAGGDTHVDAHHTVEDTAIVLGQALRDALGDKSGITRFGDATVPLDETRVKAVVDVSGRPYCVVEGEPDYLAWSVAGGFPTVLMRHVLESLSLNAGIALHVVVEAGRDPHHLLEAQVKAVARALRAAVAVDPRVVGVPSTKGSL